MAADLTVLTYGGGTQSAALALMSAAGELPKLDAVVFADTHGELPETYAFNEYVAERLEAAGIGWHVVSAGSLEAALLADKPATANPMPPAHVANPDGSKGKVGHYKCSYEYKRRVVTSQVKKLVGKPGAWKHATVEQWLGFSCEEVGRCKPDTQCRCGHNRVRPDREGQRRGHVPECTDCDCTSFDPWRVMRYPLIDRGFKRADTIRWFADHGHPTPPRSACWFCPNARNPRWQQLKRDHPELFARACTIDEAIRHGGGFTTGPMAGAMFLHDSRIPLRDADLRTEADRLIDSGQGELFDGAVLASDCASGVCFT
jgi:hypothetical protein